MRYVIFTCENGFSSVYTKILNEGNEEEKKKKIQMNLVHTANRYSLFNTVSIECSCWTTHLRSEMNEYVCFVSINFRITWNQSNYS